MRSDRVNRMRDCYVFRIRGKSFHEMPATRVARYVSAVAKVIGKDCRLLRITKHTMVFRPMPDQEQARALKALGGEDG
jgi:hypothetical protein